LSRVGKTGIDAGAGGAFILIFFDIVLSSYIFTKEGRS
jgi:hypothetical protein